MALTTLLLAATALSFVIVVAQYAFAYIRSPLKNLPGPFLAHYTDLWRLWNHYSQTHIETQQRLHAKHGNIVRLGPKTVSVTDPALIKTIYSTRGTFIKSDFYTINDTLQNNHRISNIFGTRSNDFHAQQIRPVRHLYKPQFAAELEPTMNATVRVLCAQLEQRFMRGANAGKTCDVGEWTSYFVWDFLGDMTFSSRMGFMEQGRDVGGMLVNAEKAMRYFSVVGQIPILDTLLAKNPHLPLKFPDFSNAAGFCVARFAERMQRLDDYKDKKDFMNGFLQAKEAYPEQVTDNEVIGYLIINILAGADTTGILLKALLYHLLRTPHAHTRLTRELHSTSPPLTYPPPHASLTPLPYLTACIQEALRIHPVIGHIVERVVPASGLTLPLCTSPNGPTTAAEDTITLPPGTIIGMNPWLIHRNAEIFGRDADSFVPERWLRGAGEDAGTYEARVKRMRDADMAFGNGNRTCLGKPLALVELYKVVATLFGLYKMELDDPEQEWVLDKQWFVWPHGIRVKMSPYETGAVEVLKE